MYEEAEMVDYCAPFVDYPVFLADHRTKQDIIDELNARSVTLSQVSASCLPELLRVFCLELFLRCETVEIAGESVPVPIPLC